MILGTQRSPSFFIVSFLITVTAVDIVLVVCITEPLFYATASPFQCTFHITIGDTDQNVNLTMSHSPAFKLLPVSNFLLNKSTLYLSIKGRPFNI